MRRYLVTEMRWLNSAIVTADVAARIADIDRGELEQAIDQELCRNDRYTITEHGGAIGVSNACFMVEDGDRHIGYFRRRQNAERMAAVLARPNIGELFPPEPIACEDDEMKH